VSDYPKVDWHDDGYIVDAEQRFEVTSRELIDRYNALVDDLAVAEAQLRAVRQVTKQFNVHVKALEVAVGKEAA
jgi:hypothetical protein